MGRETDSLAEVLEISLVTKFSGLWFSSLLPPLQLTTLNVTGSAAHKQTQNIKVFET